MSTRTYAWQNCRPDIYDVPQKQQPKLIRREEVFKVNKVDHNSHYAKHKKTSHSGDSVTPSTITVKGRQKRMTVGIVD